MASKYLVCLLILGDVLLLALEHRVGIEAAISVAIAAVFLRDAIRGHKELTEALRRAEHDRPLPDPPAWLWYWLAGCALYALIIPLWLFLG